MLAGAVRFQKGGIMKRPLGVILLTVYCFGAAASIALKTIVHQSATVWTFAGLLSWLVLGVGLFRLAKWGWVLSLLWVIPNALVAGYFAWRTSNTTGDTPDWIWRIEIRSAVIFLMITAYLLEEPVRRCFFRQKSGTETASE